VFNSTLPFEADTVDLLVSIAVLEHMHNASIAVSEMFRCLKPGGELVVYVPFIQPIHAAPNDYYRWTANGLRELFKGFSVVEVGVGAGPMSGFLWIAQEWIAIVTSFGNTVLKDAMLMLIMLITFPLKYLDLVLERASTSAKIASGFYIYARKSAISDNDMESGAR